jgi:glycerophosphoryl diester phosphodiesterase
MLITAFVCIPVVIRGFLLSVKMSGYSAITKENIFNVMRKPVTIGYVVVIFLIFIFSILLNITMMVVLNDEECQSHRKGAIAYAGQVNKYFFGFIFSRKIIRILYMLPFGIAIYMPALMMIIYNNSVTKYLFHRYKRNLGAWIFWGLLLCIYIAGIIIFAKRYVYIRQLILTKDDRKTADISSRIGWKRSVRVCMGQLVCNVAVVIACILAGLIIMVLAVLFISLSSPDNMLMVFYEEYDNISVVAGICMFLICGIVNAAAMEAMENITNISSHLNRDNIKKQRRYGIAGLLLVVFSLALYLNLRVMIFGSDLATSSIDEVLISAHRGADNVAPENTIPALEQAIELGADYVEIDVRLTADGEVVLMHDASTARTTDGDLLVADSTYEELQQLDAGSWFSEEYTGTRIPTLQEAINVCKGNVLMNIEIKSVDNSGELEEKVAALIADNNMEEQCVVTSFKQKSLIRIKKYDENILTGYIYGFGYSNRMNYEAMDVLSIDYRYVTREVVTGAHKKGIAVYVWTVNSRRDMRRMKAIGVDNIITDKVSLAKETMYEKSGNEIADIWKYIIKSYK